MLSAALCTVQGFESSIGLRINCSVLLMWTGLSLTRWHGHLR
jgi:hypothetical protein